MQWSPLGNYITTMHRQGAATWGGPKWERLQRFAHPDLRLIDYRYSLPVNSSVIKCAFIHYTRNNRMCMKVQLSVLIIFMYWIYLRI